MDFDLPHEVEDLFGILKLYSDATISYSTNVDSHIPISDDGSVLWKNYLFDKHHNLHLYLYNPTLPSLAALPVLYYLHSGGFCLGSRADMHIPSSTTYATALHLHFVSLSLHRTIGLRRNIGFPQPLTMRYVL
jgi:hypothetical protein